MQTNAGIINYNNRTDFVKENHRYRIDWDDSAIFPQLGAEDKVRVKLYMPKEEGSKMHREMHLLYRVRSIL